MFCHSPQPWHAAYGGRASHVDWGKYYRGLRVWKQHCWSVGTWRGCAMVKLEPRLKTLSKYLAHPLIKKKKKKTDHLIINCFAVLIEQNWLSLIHEDVSHRSLCCQQDFLHIIIIIVLHKFLWSLYVEPVSFCVCRQHAGLRCMLPQNRTHSATFPWGWFTITFYPELLARFC